MRGLGQHDRVPSSTTPASPAEPVPVPGSAGEAIGLVLAGLDWLAGADLASVPAAVQADCLRGLERARSVQAAAHASVLGAFDAGLGYQDDGSRSPRTWLMWQTQVTSATASSSIGWMRRLRAHPAIAQALREGRVSVSWARQRARSARSRRAWTPPPPPDNRKDPPGPWKLAPRHDNRTKTLHAARKP